MERLKEKFFALLRLGLGMEGHAPSGFSLTPEEWSVLYDMAVRQSVLGVAYAGIQRLPKDALPPMELAFQWASEAETIRGHNRLVNGVAARLTVFFAAEGRRSAILKGPANARLYPDPGMRQCGDIDIWVEGGRLEIESLLLKKGMLHVPDTSVPRPDFYHHFRLPEPVGGVEVEVHFRPSSGNQNPFSNARLQRFLESEMENLVQTDVGFCSPSVRFALVMQLAHVQRHFLTSGIGLRQLLDYLVLLKHSSAADRDFVSSRLRYFGLNRTAGALMWILHYGLGLPGSLLLCKPHRGRGFQMVAQAFAGGNFGLFGKERNRNIVAWWVYNWAHPLRNFFFDPVEVFWIEARYWKRFVASIPLRIRLRKISIRDVMARN